MGTQPDFAPIARALRDGIVVYHERRGEDIDSAEGRSRLDTDSRLAPERADRLLHTYLTRARRTSVEGLVVADLGCGFGSLALVLAARGAKVVAVDPVLDRARVGLAVARRFGLDVELRHARVEDAAFEPGSLDAAFADDSLCYITARGERELAYRSIHEALAPGGWLIVRNPNRAHPLDPLTGLPVVHQLPAAAARLLPRLGVRRSHVFLQTAGGATRQLRRERFCDVRFDGSGTPRRPLDRLADHHHVSGRKPDLG